MSSCGTTWTAGTKAHITEGPYYEDWKECIEETCDDQQLGDLTNQVIEQRINQETNDAGKVSKVDWDEFQSGFLAGLGVVGGAIVATWTWIFGS